MKVLHILSDLFLYISSHKKRVLATCAVVLMLFLLVLGSVYLVQRQNIKSSVWSRSNVPGGRPGKVAPQGAMASQNEFGSKKADVKTPSIANRADELKLLNNSKTNLTLPKNRVNMGTVTVGHAKAVFMPLAETLDALGTATPLTTVTLRPQVSGILTQVLFTEGQMVKKGQLLARIDSRSYEQTLMQTRGSRMRNEAQLKAALVQLERFRTLLKQDSIARQEVDSQTALVEQLQGTLLGDRASEASAKLNLEFTRITAPISGRIGLRAVDVGNNINAGSATGIATITQMQPMDVTFSIPQERITKIQSELNYGKKLTVQIFDRNRSIVLDEGVFSTLDNMADVNTGTVRAKARVNNNNDNLFPGQFVNVRITLNTDNALVVPVTAVRNSTEGNYVYVIDETTNQVSKRLISSGVSTVDVVSIVSGLKEGEIVVTEGADRLNDGSVVRLQNSANVHNLFPRKNLS